MDAKRSEPDSDDAAGNLLPFDRESTLMVGTPLVSVDGEVLGTVGDDDGGRFKVAAPLAEDYWLPKDLIAGMAPGGDLVVSVPKEDLDAVKVAGPDEA